MSRPPLLDLASSWRLGPFLVDATMRGEAGPWLSARDIERRFDSFITSPESPASSDLIPLTLRLTTDWGDWPRDGEQVPSLEVTPQAEACWRLRRTDLWGELDRPARTVTAAMAPQGPVMEECLRLLMWLELAAQSGVDGLIVHCGCAVHGGRAWCFPAASGTGKSTLIRLTPGELALSDEFVLLTRDDEGRWSAWPSPFWNWERQLAADVAPWRAYPLAGVALLAQSPETRWSPAHPLDVLVPFMEQVIAFNAFGQEAARTFELAAELVESLAGKVGWLHLRRGDDPYAPLEA